MPIEVQALLLRVLEGGRFARLGGKEELKAGRIPDKLEDAIRIHVRRVYEKYAQNITRAAEALDVSRNTVRKYL